MSCKVFHFSGMVQLYALFCWIWRVLQDLLDLQGLQDLQDLQSVQDLLAVLGLQVMRKQ